MATKEKENTEAEAPAEAGPDGPLLDLSADSVKKLIRTAKKRGYVTMDELNAVLPSQEVTSEQIEDTMAEVSLFLDNAGRTAPAAFNDDDKLQVTRRIERDAGSAYKINGRDARARDVQLLFADQSTGARSPSMATDKGRGAHPGIVTAITGEHGGDPESIAFCEQIGLDYVSCSPYRVPVARLAAAQAAIRARRGELA